MRGNVDFFHDGKKYGFIVPDDGDEDIFFHISDVEGEEVQEGEDVEFETEPGDEGPKAVDIQVV